MKRLISWLLVLAMAIACLPMSAFAVEVESGDGDPDFDVGFEELLHGYNANDPIDLTADLRPDFTATVTVPAGKTMYFTAGNVGGMEMTINGENKGVCVAAPRQPYAWSITNDGAEDAEYVITVAFPVGHQMNPEVIEELAYSSFDVEQAAGDIDGYFYTYTAPAAGTVTLYISNVPEVEVQAPEYDEDGGEITPAVTEKFVGDITVLNENTYANYVLSQDGVDNFGLELQIPVAAGDVLNINTALVADNEGNYYPAGTYSWTGNFAYPAGSEQNPIAIEWTWDDAYANATASVTVPEGATQYFTGKAGMILTANGEEIAMDAAGTFALPAGTYELKMATPVGAQANPEVIENIDGYSSTQSLDADEAYYYIWTATEDGTVTLDVTDGANITVDKLTYVEDSEWPISEQFALAEPTVDENWNYTGWEVAENLVIEVVAGQQLKIQVNGLTDWATWTVPAIDYTLTGSFEAAEPEISGVITDTGRTLSLDGVIFINQYFKVSEFAMTAQDIAANSGLLMWTEAVSDAEAVFGSESAFVNTDVVYVSKDDEYKVQSDGIVAKSYADIVYLRVFVKVAEGTYVYGPLTPYSVQEYCEGRIAKSTNAKLRNVCAYMLHYGAAAQLNFNYNTSNLANSNVPTDLYPADVYQDSMIADIADVNTNIASSEFVVDNGRTLSLSAAIQINYYYKVNSITPATVEVLLWEGVSGELTLDNVTSVLETQYDSKNKEYKATGNDIASKKYDETIFACAKVVDSEGNVYYSEIVGYHPDAYAQGRIEKSTNEKLVNLCKALVVYGEFSDAYFS